MNGQHYVLVGRTYWIDIKMMLTVAVIWPSVIGQKWKFMWCHLSTSNWCQPLASNWCADIDIYLMIQLDVNLMLPYLMCVHEINTRRIILYASLSIMAFCISGINNMTFHSIYKYYYNQLPGACKLC